MSRFFAIGTSHHHASVALREQVAFAEEEIPGLVEKLLAGPCKEAAILSTCNRTEVYFVPSDESFTPDAALDWLGEQRGIAIDREHFFALEGRMVGRHLMEVASSLDSQVVGDIQILGQVKRAYQTAKDARGLGPVLTRLFEIALRCGKRVKSETDLFSGAVSISYVAVELARKIFYPLDEQKVLVIGAGETGELTAVSLHGQGVRTLDITNRTAERGERLRKRLDYTNVIPWEERGERLADYDIVIVATGAREYVLDYDTISRAAEQTTQMLLIDLAVPRNIDPRASEIDNIFCKDLNDLNAVIAANVEKRREEIPRAEAIVSEELEDFLAWHAMAPVRPVIAELRRRAESIAREMLDEHRTRFPEDSWADVEKLVSSVVRKIIAQPLAKLLEAPKGDEDVLDRVEKVREVFGMKGEG